MTDSAWDEITRAMRAAPYPVQVFPADPQRASDCLARLEISDRSWLGAVTLNTGGLVIDHGWLRVLGSGTELLPDVVSQSQPGMVVVGYDVLGGHFAWAMAQAGAPPTVHYFGPDTLEYQDLEQGYGGWLSAMLSGAATAFYANLRWAGWAAEVAAVPVDQGISLYPPPFTAEGKDLNAVSRQTTGLRELVAYYAEM